MTKEQVSALLGRPLTTVETNNFDLYFKIARSSLETMTCTSICNETDPKTYKPREGYKTLFTDVFTDVDEITLNGDVVDEDDYTLAQWDNLNGSWYNSLIFTNKFKKGDVVTVSASWGFEKMPSDLQLILAQLFSLISKKNKLNGAVSSKQVEDFRITFNPDVDLNEEFKRDYGYILRKYSMCDIGYLRSGKRCGC